MACTGLLGTALIIWIVGGCFSVFYGGLKSGKDIDIKIVLLAFVLTVFCQNMVGIFFSLYAQRYLFAICVGVLLKLSVAQNKQSDVISLNARNASL
jgi:hypothetical protein